MLYIKVIHFCYYFSGAGKVFSDLEKGARVMIRTAGKETSKTAEHKLA